MYAVTGATGNTGRVVVEKLLAAGKDVRAISRSEKRLKPLMQKGAQPFLGSMEDAQSLALAFSGAIGVYTLIPARIDLDDYSGFQRRVGEATVAAIHEAGVEHVVNLSSLGAEHPSGTGPVVGLRAQEQRLNSLKGVNVLHLRAALFMETLYTVMNTIRERGLAGTPVSADLRMPLIASRDIGAYAAVRLSKLDFSGHTAQELLGERDVTLEEVTHVIGEAIGQPLKYVRLSYDEAEQVAIALGARPAAAKLLIEMYRGLNDGLIAPTSDRCADNTTPTSIEEFAQDFAQLYESLETAR